MNKFTLYVVALGLALSGCEACGRTSKANELTGQVKKVIDKTPIVCGDYTLVDLSLGVVRNGTGSMSHEDVELYVVNPTDVALLKEAAKTGRLVDVSYDVQRVAWCVPDHWLTAVSFAAESTPTPVSTPTDKPVEALPGFSH